MRRPQREYPSYANTLLALLMLLLPLSVQPPWKAYWPLPPVFAGLGEQVPDGVYIATGTPVEAVNWLQEHRLPGDARLFHDMGFGSYLIWALPELKVYVDPRIELYPLEEWLRYKRITAACNYNRELRQLGVTHLMLDQAGQGDLIEALERDTAWRQLYGDEQTVIFERTAAGTDDASCTSLQ